MGCTERYPFDDDDRYRIDLHVPCDADGVWWEIYTGVTTVERLDTLLDEAKAAYNKKYPCDNIDGESKVEEVLDLLDEVKDLYKAKYWPDQVDELESGHSGVTFVYSDGQSIMGQSTKVAELEGLLKQVKTLYTERYPFDDDDGY